MKHPRIISLGEVLWDLFPDGERFGGAPANFACHAAIHGANVGMLSAVGDDCRGEAAIDMLRQFGMEVGLVQTIPAAATGTVGVTLDSAGKPTFTIHENSAWDRIVRTDAIEPAVGGADAVYFGTLGQRSSVSRDTIRHGIRKAREANIPSLLDINLRSPYFDDALIRESIELASILKLSDDELPQVISACDIEPCGPAETQLSRLLESCELDFVVMTCGVRGAVLATPRDFLSQPGIRTEVRDTVGAGDSFAAAFLLGVLRDAPHDEVLHEACEIAAATCSHAGAVSQCRA